MVIDRKVGVYIATKLFQFASCKEPYTNLAGSDGFFRPCSRHCVRPSYRDFLNSFVIKARVRRQGHMIIVVTLTLLKLWGKITARAMCNENCMCKV